MAFSFGQGLFDLPNNSGDWPTLSFEKSQAIPKAYDFSLSCRVHSGSLAGDIRTVNEKRTKTQDASGWAINGRGY
jgi:hypothetical protein